MFLAAPDLPSTSGEQKERANDAACDERFFHVVLQGRFQRNGRSSALIHVKCSTPWRSSQVRPSRLKGAGTARPCVLPFCLIDAGASRRAVPAPGCECRWLG